MNIIFAPDWREGVPYQSFLADALNQRGVSVNFLQNYKRIMPLTRLLAEKECDILHLHWPEFYYPKRRDSWDWFRQARFPTDLRFALKKCMLAATAHNLHPHNRGAELFTSRNTGSVYNEASVLFVHSEIAKQRIMSEFGILESKIHVVPHGDLSAALGPPVNMEQARTQLGLGLDRVALMFGTIEPYKGIEEIIDWWRIRQPPVVLAIVGRPHTDSYGAKIKQRIGDTSSIRTQFEWLTDEQLRLWLSATNVVVFNYREIFTSGAANLARSMGVPTLLPKRLDTIVLDEPTPWIRRFEDTNSDFGDQLEAILKVSSNFDAASEWRKSCSWDRVAKITIAGYRAALLS